MLMMNDRARQNERLILDPAKGRRKFCLRFMLCLLTFVIAGVAGLIDFRVLAQSAATEESRPDSLTDGNRPVQTNAEMALNVEGTKSQKHEAANEARKKQITEDSARLLKLANDLKAEVNKTSKDTLSLGVIRKADEIERLAHEVREKMRVTAGPN